MAKFALKDQEESDCGLVKCQLLLDSNQENNHSNVDTCALNSELGTLKTP